MTLSQKKSMITKVSIHIRNWVTQYVDPETVKLISFLISLLSCLLLGSVLIFPLIAENLIIDLKFKIFEINVISSFTIIGMYFCLPGLGYLADVFDSNLLSVLSIIAFVPAYVINCYIVRTYESKLTWLCISYFFIGLGTSSLYFLSLLTCSKIYPERKGLSISLPVTSYGVSSLIATQVLKNSYFKLDDHLDLVRVFKFFAYLYLVMGALNFVSTSIIIEHTHKIDENTELIPISSIEPPNHQAKFIRFLKNPVMHILLVSLFLDLGPLETYQNNLNSIVTSIHYHNLNSQIILLSIFSTITRLVVGILSDYYNKRDILIGLLVLGFFNQILSFADLSNSINLVTIFNGINYGGVFTIYPTIIAELWGVDMLGSTWGLFMISPAISTPLFSLIYGRFLDKIGNLDVYFKLCATAFAISLLLVISVRKVNPFH